ncbi:MAG: hypothetical protein SFX18_17310 [Pirellulales bacterium]|nr:hypothetical protein [Pirellulales bacterium]
MNRLSEKIGWLRRIVALGLLLVAAGCSNWQARRASAPGWSRGIFSGNNQSSASATKADPPAVKITGQDDIPAATSAGIAR